MRTEEQKQLTANALLFWETSPENRLQHLQSLLKQNKGYAHLFDVNDADIAAAISNFVKTSIDNKLHLLDLLKRVDLATGLAVLKKTGAQAPIELIHAMDQDTLPQALQTSAKGLSDYQSGRQVLVDLCTTLRETGRANLEDTLPLIVAPLAEKFGLYYAQVCMDLVIDSVKNRGIEEIDPLTNTLIGLYANAAVTSAIDKTPYPQQQLHTIFGLEEKSLEAFGTLMTRDLDHDADSPDLILSKRADQYNLRLIWLLPTAEDTATVLVAETYYKTLEQLLLKLFNQSDHALLKHGLAAALYYLLKHLQANPKYQRHTILVLNITASSVLRTHTNQTPLCRKTVKTLLSTYAEQKDAYPNSVIPIVKIACQTKHTLGAELLFDYSSLQDTLYHRLFTSDDFNFREVEFLLAATIQRICAGADYAYPDSKYIQPTQHLSALLLPETKPEKNLILPAVDHLLTTNKKTARYLMLLNKALCQVKLNAELIEFWRTLASAYLTLQKKSESPYVWAKIAYVYLVVNLHSIGPKRLIAMLNVNLSFKVATFFNTLTSFKPSTPYRLSLIFDTCRGYARYLLSEEKTDAAHDLALKLTENPLLKGTTDPECKLEPTQKVEVVQCFAYFMQIYPEVSTQKILSLLVSHATYKMQLTAQALLQNLLADTWQKRLPYFFIVLCHLWYKLPEDHPDRFNVANTLNTFCYLQTQPLEFHTLTSTLTQYSIDQLEQPAQLSELTTTWHQLTLSKFANFLLELSKETNNSPTILNTHYADIYKRLAQAKPEDSLPSIPADTITQLSFFFKTNPQLGEAYTTRSEHKF